MKEVIIIYKLYFERSSLVFNADILANYFQTLKIHTVYIQPELKIYPGKFLHKEIQKNDHKPLDLQYI